MTTYQQRHRHGSCKNPDVWKSRITFPTFLVDDDGVLEARRGCDVLENAFVAVDEVVHRQTPGEHTESRETYKINFLHSLHSLSAPLNECSICKY